MNTILRPVFLLFVFICFIVVLMVGAASADFPRALCCTYSLVLHR